MVMTLSVGHLCKKNKSNKMYTGIVVQKQRNCKHKITNTIRKSYIICTICNFYQSNGINLLKIRNEH